MSALRQPRRQLIRLLGLGGTAALLTAWQTSEGMSWMTDARDVPGRILDMRHNLPQDMANGSVLEDVQFDGNRLTLRLAVDDRLDLAAVRDGDRDDKCDAWRAALRKRELTSVEYRYVQTGAMSSLFLDRSVCS
ncbi:hypothetical protein [Aureimonas sp. AU4]|uniref:hypothetical protein n=1 Tax=Aureimonas sp. AU4 TaxID=1638163 RepID=UPI000A703FF5|nr:hypothetical protein [Aureimonas sp. AU4]